LGVRGRRLVRIDPSVWNKAEMVSALGARDVCGIYRVLQTVGVTQRRIADMTGQSQSEISEILAGRRVASYDVLIRIADGLGVPRGRMGLAYDKQATKAYEGGALMPVFDAGSGCWVVQVPTFIDSYEAALVICESLTAARPDDKGQGRSHRSQERLVAIHWLSEAAELVSRTNTNRAA
jgi:transcriptional regulator with XRE-family HTH domain